jgi:Fe/S biogenesis protein NfuA
MSAQELTQDELKVKVQEILDDMINPAIAGHGGFIRLLDVRENNVYVMMGGGCQGCGMADVTLKSGIETMLKEEIPQIAGVIDQTDHAEGRNPYYQPSK